MEVTRSMAKLIGLLDDVAAVKGIGIYFDKENDCHCLDESDRYVADASVIASSILFDNKGRLQFEQKRILQHFGYRTIQIKPSDMGWLIAGIEIEGKGLIKVRNYALEGGSINV